MSIPGCNSWEQVTPLPKRNRMHSVTPPDSVKSEARRASDRKQTLRRGTAAERGYSYAWQRHAAGFLSQYPYCIACVDRQSQAVLVDHIVPARQGTEDSGTRDPLFFAAWNHQPLCRFHHDVKTRHDGVCSEARDFALGVPGSDTEQRDLLLRHIRLWSRWVDLSWQTEHHTLRGWSLTD